MTYNPATDAGRVRLLCTDTGTVEMFSDAEIVVFLELCGNVILLAAAMALDVTAASEVLVQKRIQLMDLKTDGPGEAAALKVVAESYRTQAASLLGFDWAENPVDVFALREKLEKDALRGLPW